MRLVSTACASRDCGPGPSLRVAGLFAGIGGLELGLSLAGHRPVAAAEVWDPARAVLMDRQPEVPLFGDVATIEELPRHEILAAGFPCNDLSPAGLTAGITGPQSGLVRHVFRLARRHLPEWILLENVPNLLVLHGGNAMRAIVTELERIGYRWAYRVVDSRCVGVPQRRLRVVLLAAQIHRPEAVLLRQDAGAPKSGELRRDAFGFYWTEGRGGLGWAQDAIPTLKGGSTIGINSAPAVWLPGQPPGRRLIIPSIEDGERLQGFPPGWTASASRVSGRDHRWKLVGNAVTVGIARWVGAELAVYDAGQEPNLEPASAQPTGRWPTAAYGFAGQMWTSDASAWPVREPYEHLGDFLDITSARPLSHRATTGFLRRVDESNLRIDPTFVRDVEMHAHRSRPSPPSLTRPPRIRGEEAVPAGSWASSMAARNRMRANRGRDTKPELSLRKALHARGLRYRVQARPTPEIRNRLDVVFRPAKVAVDVRGCFWHACRLHATQPKANSEIWAAKLRRNVERDSELAERLALIGWHLEVVWEHEDPRLAAKRVADLVASRRQPSKTGTAVRPS